MKNEWLTKSISILVSPFMILEWFLRLDQLLICCTHLWARRASEKGMGRRALWWFSRRLRRRALCSTTACRRRRSGTSSRPPRRWRKWPLPVLTRRWLSTESSAFDERKALFLLSSTPGGISLLWRVRGPWLVSRLRGATRRCTRQDQCWHRCKRRRSIPTCSRSLRTRADRWEVPTIHRSLTDTGESIVRPPDPKIVVHRTPQESSTLLPDLATHGVGWSFLSWPQTWSHRKSQRAAETGSSRRSLRRNNPKGEMSHDVLSDSRRWDWRWGKQRTQNFLQYPQRCCRSKAKPCAAKVETGQILRPSLSWCGSALSWLWYPTSLLAFRWQSWGRENRAWRWHSASFPVRSSKGLPSAEAFVPSRPGDCLARRLKTAAGPWRVVWTDEELDRWVGGFASAGCATLAKYSAKQACDTAARSSDPAWRWLAVVSWNAKSWIDAASGRRVRAAGEVRRAVAGQGSGGPVGCRGEPSKKVLGWTLLIIEPKPFAGANQGGRFELRELVCGQTL